MKKYYLFYSILLSALLLTVKATQSQTIDFTNYSVLKSAGEIPDVVIKALSLKNESEISKEISGDNKKTATQKKAFLMKNDCEIFQMVRNGNVLFNDPIGDYITKVAKELLKDNPQLFKELHFYTLKYPEINAFSNNNGFVFVDIGLVANLETEAELAFILAHEISHYVKKHPMEAHLENLKIFKGKSAYRFKNNYQKLDLIGKRSRDIEFEADSLGTNMFLASAYNTEAIDITLNRLHYSYIPFSDVPFDTRFFNDGDFVVPACYFLDTCAKKTVIKDTYDENYSHPNIFKRKLHIKSMLANKQPVDGKDYLVSESEFNYVRKIARFELVHLNVRNKEYGDAIYNAYALLTRYPDNKYLELCIAKSLYGLTKYKNEDKYFYVAEPYEKAEEQSQQIHFFLKQLNRKQLNVLSVKYIQKMKQKYPATAFLDKLETDLIDEMIIKNDIDFEKFKNQENPGSKEILNPALSKRELQKKNENFYLMAFSDDALNNAEFIRKCTEAKDKKEAENGKSRISAQDKEEKEKKILESMRSKGLGIQIGDLIVLDPYLEIDKEKIESEYVKYDNNKKELDKKVIESAGIAGLKPVMISSREIYIDNNIQKYNELCLYREMMRENMSNDLDFFYPIGAEYFSNEQTTSKDLLCYIGLFDDISDDQYYISFIDLNTGETVYWNEKTIQKGNFDKIKKYLTDDFQVLTKH